MRVFVYEYMTATGVGRRPDDADHRFFVEGRAMWEAVAADFARIPGVEVVTLPEPPDAPEYGTEREAFRQAASTADWSLVIAPEISGLLYNRCHMALDAGSRVLGPTQFAVQLTGNKYRLCSEWELAGVPTPRTHRFGGDLPFPFVLKPDTGAGSECVFLVHEAEELHAAQQAFRAQGWHEQSIVCQEYVPGRAASIAFLCGPGGNVPLEPTLQLLSDDGRFHYQGGELPIPPPLAQRAIQLGASAVECVPGLLGYVGVDLVLGGAADGSADFAIEINPRLTTSYIGLRALAGFNIAHEMLKIAAGESARELRWKPARVRFGAAGDVRWC
jgi:predicted ATP-grasp superfamily ATP-dependent carboligase